MMLAMVPNNGVFAAEPDKFVTSANANHWGRSDLRAYLNNGLTDVGENGSVSNKYYGIDSTKGDYKSDNKSGYARMFSDTEYGLVQPFTYSTYTTNNTTNIFDIESPKVTAVYETTDKFWLPSGNSDSDQVISWAEEDISSASQYTMTTATNKQRLIPVSYWSYGALTYSWLRSPFYVTGHDSRDNYYHVLCLTRGFRVWDKSLLESAATAAAFKIDLKDVVFASTASAKAIAAEDGAEKIEISGSLNFGKRTRDSLPDYGMYLKTKSTGNFEPTGLTFDDTNLTVNYTGGVKDQYVVVHAFKEDSLTDGHTSYVAAQKLESGNSSATINVSAWDLSSLDGYTIKVWMEDNSGNLAAATTPYTFVGSDGAISKDINGAGATNSRVFAMKNELQCSWGDLSALSDDDYQRVITLKDVTTDLFGKNPTNQKIYFGADSSGNPLEFWIAGRESAVNGGEIAADGQFMTLYQAKLVERKQFNDSTDMYQKTNDNAVTLQLVENQSYSVDAIEKIYPQDQITFKQGNNDLDKTDLKWQHRKPGTTAWTDGMPTTPGKYEIRCYAEGMENYERTFSANVTFTVLSKPSAADFDFIPPQNLIYDGQPKEATVEPKSGITGVGAVTIKYFDSTGNQLETAPTDVGPYTVKIDVKEGDLYAAATDLTGADWNFTITEKTVVAPDEPSEPEDFNKSDWGDEEIHSGIKHYVDTNGTTSVEVSENGMIWLREESEGTAAWYGLDNTSGIFKKGSRFYVQWLNENDHPEAFANIDSNTKAEVEDDNGWLFKVGVIAPDGTRYEKLDEKVDLYVQIGDDWDRDDLAAFYISQGEDENIPVRYETSDYPEGEDEFGIMTLSHFSPYFIYDKLTDEEKAEADESTKTGDEVTYFAVSGLGLIMTLALGLMLNSKINKKKSD